MNDQQQRERDEGKRRAALLRGDKLPRVFKSQGEFIAARRAVAVSGGQKALKEFDQKHRTELVRFWTQPTATVPAHEAQLDRLWGLTHRGVVMAKPSAQIKTYSISDATFDVVPSSNSKTFDRFRKTILKQGRWSHPQHGYTLDATASFLRDLADKFKRLRGQVEPFVALGHNRDPLAGVGHVADLDVVGSDGALQLVATLDVTEPDVAAKLRNKSLRGVSVAIDEAFELALPDGRVERVGNWLEHLAISQLPVIGGMGDFEFVPIN